MWDYGMRDVRCTWAIAGAGWKEQAGEHIAEICEAVQSQSLSIAPSSIAMFYQQRSRQEYRSLTVFSYMLFIGRRKHHPPY